jgi:uncharacterized protein HemX
MAANTTILIIVAAIAVLVFAGMAVGVVCKTRARQRRVNAEAFHDQAQDDARRLQRRQALTEAYDARTQAAQIEIDNKTIRAGRLQQQSNVQSREAATTLRTSIKDM